MTLLFDAGAFIALERRSTLVEGLLRDARDVGSPALTHGGIVGQVWRDGARQALLARALRASRVVPLTAGIGRDAGRLLAASGTGDVIDAALVTLAQDGDLIVTSDPDDLARLLEVHGANVGLIVV